jgi:8-oxo-dGTP pyrophosphatase MutT (NUDIX family)
MEFVDLFDNKRNSLGKISERYSYTPGEFSQVVHLWIRNSQGDFLVQKRSMSKPVNPGIWSVTGGAVDSGETPLEAAYRECKEELDVEIKPEEIQLMMTVKRPKVFVDVFLVDKDINLSDIKMQETEVDDVKWFNRDEIREMSLGNKMGGSITIYYDSLFKLIDNL